MHALSLDFTSYSIETGTLDIEAGVTITANGLNVDDGGVTVADGKLLAPDAITINSTIANRPLLTALASHSTYADDALYVRGGCELGGGGGGVL